MRIRSDLVVFALIALLAGYAVAKQLGVDPLGGDEDAIAALALGEVLDPDTRVTLIGTPPFQDTLGSHLGETATVLYSWSIKCPCTDVVEGRLRPFYMQHNKLHGVQWIAINGEPAESPEDTLKEMMRVRAFYKMVLDPQQQFTRRLGMDRAVQIVILDGEGRVRYRGSPDDDYEEGNAEWFREAFEAVVAGRIPPVGERPPAYGCLFDDPASCEEYEQRTPQATGDPTGDEKTENAGFGGPEGGGGAG